MQKRERRKWSNLLSLRRIRPGRIREGTRVPGKPTKEYESRLWSICLFQMNHPVTVTQQKVPKARHVGHRDAIQTSPLYESLRIHRYTPSMIPPKFINCPFRLLFLHSIEDHPLVLSRILLTGLMKGLLGLLKFQLLTCRKCGEGDQGSQIWCQRVILLPKTPP
jgi:hypothetical protein